MSDEKKTGDEAEESEAGSEPEAEAGSEPEAEAGSEAEAEAAAGIEAETHADTQVETDADEETAAKTEAAKAPPKPVESSPARPDKSRTHRLRGGLVFSMSSLLAFLAMASADRLPRGPLIGIFLMVGAAFGMLDFLGLLVGKREGATPIGQTAFGQLEGEPAFCAPRVTATAAFAIFVLGCVFVGYPGFPWVVVATLAALLPSAIRRPGLLVFIVAVGIYLPFLGAYGLWDPWETHYGEVAREILSRDDWISLWWAQEDWFWSKPILIFWTEALSMGALAVDFHPDANPLHPEWAVRLPVFLFSTCAVMSVYFAIGRLFSKRAGVLAAIVVATMPHFFFLAHQAITDMFLVSHMTMAMSCLLLAFAEGDREVKTYQLGPITLSGQHAIIASLVLVCLPQVLYLASRNVTLYLGEGFNWHGDEFLFGSAGNHDVPGNKPLSDMQPAVPELVAQPMAQAIYWAIGLGLLLFFCRKERRAQSLYMFAFYVFCGIAFMGKGIPGFALPGLVALLYLVASRRWSLLLEGRLRVAVGMLTVAVTGMPWYVAMYMRHGPGFTDRILVHDHINRLASGVHGDKGSIEYFVEQLGFSMFPWVALVPAALTAFVWRQRSEKPAPGTADYHRDETHVFVAIWFASAFVLFSAMITKFHHYIFPAVPPAAILVGLLLDRLIGRDAIIPPLQKAAGTVLAVVAAVTGVLGVAGLWGDVRGIIPDDIAAPLRADWVLAHPWPTTVSRGLVMAACLMLVAAAAFLFRANGKEEKKDDKTEKIGWAVLVVAPLLGTFGPTWLLPIAALAIVLVLVRYDGRIRSLYEASEQPVMIAIGASALCLIAFVARDLSWVNESGPRGYQRLINLFIYNYERPWPDQFDYRPILTGFGIVCSTLVGLLIVRPIRPVAGRALVGAAIAFAVWCLDVYIVDLSPHWGQRDLIKAYYDARNGPDEHLLAWQMNWKGENFYTGNRVYAFADLDNEKLREWLAAHDGDRVFFVLEHTRLGSLRNVLGDRRITEVTDKKLCNKFVIVEVTL